MQRFILILLFATPLIAQDPDTTRVRVYRSEGGTQHLYQLRFCGASGRQGTPCVPTLKIGPTRYTALELRRIAINGAPEHGFCDADVYLRDGTILRNVAIGAAKINGVTDFEKRKDPLAIQWYALDADVKELRFEHGDEIGSTAKAANVCTGVVVEAGSIGMKSFGFSARCNGTTYGFHSENPALMNAVRNLAVGTKVRVQFKKNTVEKSSDGTTLYAEFEKLQRE